MATSDDQQHTELTVHARCPVLNLHLRGMRKFVRVACIGTSIGNQYLACCFRFRGWFCCRHCLWLRYCFGLRCFFCSWGFFCFRGCFCLRRSFRSLCTQRLRSRLIVRRRAGVSLLGCWGALLVRPIWCRCTNPRNSFRRGRSLHDVWGCNELWRGGRRKRHDVLILIHGRVCVNCVCLAGVMFTPLHVAFLWISRRWNVSAFPWQLAAPLRSCHHGKQK